MVDWVVLTETKLRKITKYDIGGKLNISSTRFPSICYNGKTVGAFGVPRFFPYLQHSSQLCCCNVGKQHKLELWYRINKSTSKKKFRNRYLSIGKQTEVTFIPLMDKVVSKRTSSVLKSRDFGIHIWPI